MATTGTVKQAQGFQISARPTPAEPADPAFKDLSPLPGGGTGEPLFISNNPEEVESNGLLGGTVMPKRTTRSMSGSIPSLQKFGYYLHHINKTGGTRRLYVLASTPATRPVKVQVRGAINANSWSPGQSAPVQTARGLLKNPMPIDREIVIQPGSAAALSYIEVKHTHVVDGRLFIEADGPLIVRDVLVPAGASASVALELGMSHDAEGHIARAGGGKMGRCAGLYQYGRWKGSLGATVDEVPFSMGYRFDDKEQAFDAIANYADSSVRSYGNYGTIYELDVKIQNASGSNAAISLQLVSYPKGQYGPAEVDEYVASIAKEATAHGKKVFLPSRLWDGPIIRHIDGRNELVHLFTKPVRGQPDKMRAGIVSCFVAQGKSMQFRLTIPVPGLIAIPAGLVIKAVGAKAQSGANSPGWAT
jgi:hypothetical protein